MGIKDPVFWLRVIKFIIELVLSGVNKNEAVSAASIKFGIPKSDIWNHGGF